MSKAKTHTLLTRLDSEKKALRAENGRLHEALAHIKQCTYLRYAHGLAEVALDGQIMIDTQELRKLATPSIDGCLRGPAPDT